MLSPWRVCLSVLIGVLWLAILPRLVRLLLAKLGMVRPNFQGTPIPVGFGLVILLWSAPILALLMPLDPRGHLQIKAYLAVLVGMGLLGLLDDLKGDRRAAGLRGHLRAFLHGEITTGFVKAAGGLLLAIVVSRMRLHDGWADALLDGAIIALSANALNLLDVRPGRACAVFLACALIVVAAQVARHRVPWLLFVVAPALLVYPRDARAEVMLGDTGSNLLGGTLGLSLVLVASPLAIRAGLLALLVVLHVISERHSLSALIEQNPVLRRLDALTGRRNPPANKKNEEPSCKP